MSYILSGNPTNRMQKRKGRDWNLPQLVGHTETKNKNNINNELKSHHTGYTDQHHSEKIQVLLQMLSPGNIPGFLQAGSVSVFEKPC